MSQTCHTNKHSLFSLKFSNFGNFRERGAIENEIEYDHAARGGTSIHAEQSIGTDACCSVRFDLA